MVMSRDLLPMMVIMLLMMKKDAAADAPAADDDNDDGVASLQVSYALSEGEYTAGEFGDGWASRLLVTLEVALLWMQPLLTTNNYEVPATNPACNNSASSSRHACINDEVASLVDAVAADCQLL